MNSRGQDIGDSLRWRAIAVQRIVQAGIVQSGIVQSGIVQSGIIPR